MKKNSTLIALILILGILTNCKKNDSQGSLDVSTLELHYDDTHQFKLIQDDKKVEKASWSSSDKTVGTITDDGLFTALKIGETKITANKATCNVTVVPYYNTLEEPYFLYGATHAEIKAKENRTLLSETSGQLSQLNFKGENNKVNSIRYLFEDNKLFYILVFFNSDINILREAKTFYRERYLYVDVQNEYTRVIDDTKELMVKVGNNDLSGNHATYGKYVRVSKPTSNVETDDNKVMKFLDRD